MKNNPLKKLEALGQAIWFDYIRCDLMTSGELQRLIDEDGLRGITSNPSIFQKAIAESNLYDSDIAGEALAGKDSTAIYEAISQRDVQQAADMFKSVYEKTNAKDGYVSLEVNPHLAHDTKGTIDEARLLWKNLNRPNVLIKVPATLEGVPAIRQLISEGININVTLIFSVARYKAVLDAYIGGISDRLKLGKPIKNIASVASFFLSRIDAVVDPLLEKLAPVTSQKLRGQVAVSSAKQAYQIYQEAFENREFLKLGAAPQRLLWASTSPKDPTYSDIKYVEALIGSNTVNTVPPETLAAYRDHGNPALLLETDVEKATQVLSELPKIGINLNAITDKLENDGVASFKQAYDKLIDAIKTKSTLTSKE
ncbi:MAG TPA: transaldolase [Paludibacteraceae bacterium]|nr:transaldolase [Paludibacteraceae bacterium]